MRVIHMSRRVLHVSASGSRSSLSTACTTVDKASRSSPSMERKVSSSPQKASKERKKSREEIRSFFFSGHASLFFRAAFFFEPLIIQAANMEEPNLKAQELIVTVKTLVESDMVKARLDTLLTSNLTKNEFKQQIVAIAGKDVICAALRKMFYRMEMMPIERELRRVMVGDDPHQLQTVIKKASRAGVSELLLEHAKKRLGLLQMAPEMQAESAKIQTS